jgi:XcyI restriction endonuclease
MDALAEALQHLDQAVVKEQIAGYVPGDVQKILASAGIRDEHVFPVPAVILAKPSLIGYYRLLLGAPQKSFYSGSTGLGSFKRMEDTGTISAKQQGRVPDLCRAMATPLAELVRQVPGLTTRDLAELPLLTFGSQLQGSNNTQIGKKAMQEVFTVIMEIVGKYTKKKEALRLTVRNSAGRTVLISLSHDPDVRIEEAVGKSMHHKVAIEVKGGTDASNAHNRAGEAEKSHLKAKAAGFPEFWTIISKKGLDLAKLKAESQTTNHWFDVAEVLARKGSDWHSFRERLSAAVGIPAK